MQHYESAYFLILYHKLRSLIFNCCAAFALLLLVWFRAFCIKRRNRLQVIFKVVMVSVLCVVPVYAYDLAVVIGSEVGVDKLTAVQVQRIFLRKERLTRKGKLWVPVNLKANQRQREIFTEKILQKSHFELERYWNEQYFNGISPPYVLASEEAVIRFVKETPFALGYILSCHVDARVKVVYSFRLMNSDAQLCR